MTSLGFQKFKNIHMIGIGGSGMIGELPKEMDEMKFLKLLRNSFNAKGIRHTKLLNRPIKKVALCGGSGSFLLKNALSAKADIFI